MHIETNGNLRLANSLLDKRQYGSALKEFEVILKADPRNEHAYCGLGHLYLQQHRITDALAAFNKAVEINPESGSAHQGIGTIYLEQKQYLQAEAEFEIALLDGKGNIFIHQMLGYIYKKRGKHDQAADEFVLATRLRLSQANRFQGIIKEPMYFSNQDHDFSLKLLRLPSFPNRFEINSTELDCSLLPPLAMGQLASYLRANGFNVDQDDLNISINYDNYFSDVDESKIDTGVFFDESRMLRYIAGGIDQEIDLIMSKIESKTKLAGYKAILLSLPIIFSNTTGFMFVLSLARFLKNRYNPIIIAGGGNQTIDLLGKYGRKDIDFVIYGDGELVLHGLLLALKRSIPMESFMDYQVKQGGNLVSTEIYPPLKPDFEGLPIDKYRFRGKQEEYGTGVSKILDEFNHSGVLLLPFKFIKGCPNECVFCPESTNKLIYALEPVVVSRYLGELQQRYRPTGFFFLSDTINISKKFVNELCDAIIEGGTKILWTDSARADNLDRATVFKMRAAGCIRLVFGMETGSPALLKRIDKRLGLRGLENILRWSDEAGIWTGLEIICGLPFESESYVQETLDFLNKNKRYINTLYFNQFGLRDGSVLLKEASRFGLNNVIEINQYSDEEFTYFHKYGYDEKGGLCWKDKKKQILSSHRRLVASIDWNTEFPIYEFEHFLFFLYSKLGNKAAVRDLFTKAQKEKMDLVSLIKNKKTGKAAI